MATYEVIKTGSCTTFVTHTFLAEADSLEEAVDQVNEGLYKFKTSEFEIDDDYSTVTHTTKVSGT